MILVKIIPVYLIFQLNSQSRRIEDNISKTCVTVSGPNPGKPCVFPFRYQNKVYTGCDTDPDDSTKTWCSTKTDKNGRHVTGQNEYGHCGINCPRQPISTNSAPFGNFFVVLFHKIRQNAKCHK